MDERLVIIGLILLVLGIVVCFVPIICLAGIPLAIVGLILLLIGLVTEERPSMAAIYPYPPPYVQYPVQAPPPAAPSPAQPAPYVAPQPVQPSSAQAVHCPRCGRPLTYVYQYQRWYCPTENVYPWG